MLLLTQNGYRALDKWLEKFTALTANEFPITNYSGTSELKVLIKLVELFSLWLFFFYFTLLFELRTCYSIRYFNLKLNKMARPKRNILDIYKEVEQKHNCFTVPRKRLLYLSCNKEMTEDRNLLTTRVKENMASKSYKENDAKRIK